MKKIVLLITAISSLSIALSAKEIPVKSAIKEVTVYLQGANISREARTGIPAGTSTLVLTGLSKDLNANTIQAGGSGDFTILSVEYETYYPYVHKMPKEVKQLQDSLAIYREEKNRVDNEIVTFNHEVNMILANQLLTSKETSVSVAQLTAMADFYRKRLNDISEKQYKKNIASKKLFAKIQRIQGELSNKDQLLNKREGRIRVEVSALHPVTANLTLSYYVYSARWTPFYDLRAGDDAKTMKTSFKVNVNQSTGVDWKGVSLSFSTAQAHLDNTRPNIRTWWLNFLAPPAPVNMRGARTGMDSYTAVSATGVYENEESLNENKKTKSLANSTVVLENMLNVNYTISVPFDVPSDDGWHKLDVKELDIPMMVNYYVVPALDQTVFLVANIADWSRYNLLSGQANLFYDNTYVGQAYLNSKTIDDTLRLSLGRDNGINVKRELVKDMNARKVIGNSIKETKSYEIIIKNTKKVSIAINIDEAFPVSANKDITVKLLTAGGAKVDTDKGFLTWQKTIQPGESVKLIYTFEVKYPKGFVINL